MNTLRALLCLALLLPACLGPRAVDSLSTEILDDGEADIEQVIFRDYPAPGPTAVADEGQAPTPAPVDAASPGAQSDDAASPMDGADESATDAPSPATRDDEPAPSPSAPSDESPAPAPDAPSPEAVDEPEPAPLLDLGERCSEDAECATGFCEPTYVVIGATPTTPASGYVDHKNRVCSSREYGSPP